MREYSVQILDVWAFNLWKWLSIIIDWEVHGQGAVCLRNLWYHAGRKKYQQEHERQGSFKPEPKA